MIQPPKTILVDSVRVCCDGATEIRGGAALGHPRVWLEIDEKGFVECGECDRRFVLRGGAAEPGRHDVGAGDINPEKGAAAV
jgi:uncharacterized Zn-finger protein